MNLLILKTNINSEGHLNEISPHLSSHPSIAKWTVDLEDCDKVLRVETSHLSESGLIELLSQLGFVACDLDETYGLKF